MKILKKLIKKSLGNSFFYNGFYEIESSLEGLTSILDLGCGDNSPYLRYWIKNNHNSIGVDLYANKYFSKNYKIIQKDVITNPVYYLEEALSAEQKIKNKFNTHCRVSFEKTGAGEIRIFFESKQNLIKILNLLS
jgi:hypothetical protein